MRIFISAAMFSIFFPVFCSPLAAQTNPVPFVHIPLSPAAAAPGGPGFTLTVNGAGFASGAVVQWNGSARQTTVAGPTRLTASIPASDIAAPASVVVTVSNPGPGGGISNVAIFEVTTPTTSLAFTRSDTAFNEGGPTILKPGGMAVGFSPVNYALSLAVGSGCTPIDNCLPGQDVILVLSKNGVANAYVGGGVNSFVMGDFDGDRIPDLAAFGSNDFFVSMGDSAGNFSLGKQYPLPSGVSITSPANAVGDFHGNGRLDIVLAGDSTVYFLPGNGDGTFGAAASLSTGAPVGTTYVAAGDFNGDGKLDLAATNEMGNSVSIFLGNGDGTFNAHVDYPTGSFPEAVITGDFNRDGILDLAVVNALDATVSILLGNGDGTFHTKIDYPAGVSPFSLSEGDYNGDGFLDLAVSDSHCTNSGCAASGSVNVLLGNGDGTFQSHLDFAAGALPEAIASGDFVPSNPAAGRSGFAVANYQDNTVSVFSPIASQGGTTNPLPTISSISPPYVIQNSGAFTLTVNGTNLVSSSTVSYGGQVEPTTFVNPTQLTAAIPASAVAAAGPVSVLVLTPSPGGGNSTSSTFDVLLPPPALTSINPSSVIVGSPGFTLTINGTNFVSGTTANLNGASRPVTFVNSTQITTLVSASDVMSQGTINVSVTNPFFTNDAGGGTSSSLSLMVLPTSSQPTIGALVPASATAGGPAFTLTITGTGFVPASAVTFGSSPVSSVYQSPTELQAAIPAKAIAEAGTPLVTVTNPGGSPSLVVSFLIVADYNVSAPSPTDSVLAGATANYNLLLMPANNTLSGTVTFSASGLPAGASTTFTPPSVSAGNPGTTVKLAITTMPHTAMEIPRGAWPVDPSSYGIALLGIAIICFWFLILRNRMPLLAPKFLIVLLLAIAACLAACGGSGSSYAPPLNPATGTPAGTYNITVKAMSGNATVVTSLTLIVQ